jgi:hypothetical protein
LVFRGEAFRERLLALAGQALKKQNRASNYRAAPEVKLHSEALAMELVLRGMEIQALTEEELLDLP